MSKKLYFFLFVIFTFIAYILGFDRFVYTQTSKISSGFQQLYLNTIVSTQTFFDRYINQIDYIDQLKIDYEANQKYKLLYSQLQNQFNELNSTLQSKYSKDMNLTTVKVLRYESINESSKVILDYEFNDKNIKGLITYDGFSAGIVLLKNKQSVANLNPNDKCNYTVYIGNQNSTGITSGYDFNGKMRIDFIPNWHQVNIGDEVITSGMDGIFPYGIKVGKVVSIEAQENTKSAMIQPYANLTKSRFFYLYEN